ncbi:MAG: phosphatidate cytidylyltransferase [Oligoflexia bacterium]|nr:phosphatidate cytidylyltransferase [Oligoflexia bacterium]
MQIMTNFYFFSTFTIGFFCIYALSKRFKELLNRCLTLIVLLHLFCFVLWAGKTIFTILIAIILLLSFYELNPCNKIKSIVLLSFTIVLSAYLLVHAELTKYFLPMYFIVSAFPFVVKNKYTNNNYYLSIFTLFFLVPSALSLILIYSINLGWIIAILLLLNMNDGFGYLFGKKYGKTKIFKNISPNKTLEGYLSGAIGIILGEILLSTIIPLFKEYTIKEYLIVFIAIFFLGNVGDLLFSKIKRSLGIKDFGKMLPGHGGILDRFDNTLFVAPVIYFLLESHILF